VRGALTPLALRRTIGGQAFFQTLRTWTKQHRYANATTADFIQTAEQVSGRYMQQFFAEWLTATKMPALPTG